MTPCEELGYKVGDQFEVISTGFDTDPIFYIGSIIELIKDDGTHNPKFKLVDGEESNYMTRHNYDDHYFGISKIRPITKEWNGEGLPPVGTVCEYNAGGKYESGKIACHLTGIRGDVLIAFQLDGEGYALAFDTSLFRPIKSAREKAIDEMAKDASITKTTASINLLGSLYDAGYRKP